MIVTVAVVVAFAAVVAAAVAANRDPNRDPNEKSRTTRALGDTRSADGGPIDAMIGSIAAPMLQTTTVRRAATAAMWKNLRGRIVGSGLYGGSFDVYFAYQLAGGVIAAGCFLVALTADLTTPATLAVAAIAVAVGGSPTWKLRRRLQRRAIAAGDELPEFVELLSMCLTTMSVRSAIAFSVTFTSGTVANSARWLLDTLDSRTMDETSAFVAAGERVGTAEAVAFFTTLGRGHTEGAKIVDIINKQAESLRVQTFNRRRGDVKRLPTRMIVIFGLHFLPLLFAVAAIPLLLGFSDF